MTFTNYLDIYKYNNNLKTKMIMKKKEFKKQFKLRLDGLDLINCQFNRDYCVATLKERYSLNVINGTINKDTSFDDYFSEIVFNEFTTKLEEINVDNFKIESIDLEENHGITNVTIKYTDLDMLKIW